MSDTDSKKWPLIVVGRLVVWGSIVAALWRVFFIVIYSIKPTGDTQTIPPKLVFVPTLEHYAAVFGGQTSSSQAFLPLLWHSAVVAVCSTALTILVGLPAAYALARVRFKGRHFLATWILSTIMFPPIVAAIPVFFTLGKLQLFDTSPILIIPYTAFNFPLVVWLLRSFIAQIPAEIEDAARVDGCSRIGVLRKIILPLVVPGLAAGAILSLILC